MPRYFVRMSLEWGVCFERPCSVKLSELDGVHEFNGRLAGVDNGGVAGLGIDTLDVDALVGGLSFSLGLVVSADAILEGLTAAGKTDVLNTDVNALGDNARSNALVHDDTNGVLGDVPDSTGLTMVELVGHTSLDGTISDDIDVVTLLVDGEVLVEGRDTVLSECSAEEISRASSKTKGVGHFSFKPSKYLI